MTYGSFCLQLVRKLIQRLKPVSALEHSDIRFCVGTSGSIRVTCGSLANDPRILDTLNAARVCTLS